jgi:PPIC-type PPIASE domain
MSTALLTPEATISTPTSRRRAVPSWLREPLLHFVLLGAVLFGVDSLLASREEDPHTIVVDAEVDRQAIEVFKEARGREPNAEELYALRRVWLDNEVLYREGLALELDRGDKTIRERVIFKALSVVDVGLELPPFDDDVLRDWFERNRVKYDEPARYDFQEAVLAGERSESALRSFAAALNAGNPGDAQAGLRLFRARPHENLVQSYGAEFAAALEAAPPGEWQVLSSRDGPRVMQLETTTPAKPAVFEELRGVVLQDWTDAVMAEQRSAAVRALARKYTVKVAGEDK